DADGPGDALDRIVRDLGVVEAGSLVLDEGMRADHAALVQDMLPGAHRAFTGQTLGRLRMRKGPEEFAALKESAHAADAAMGAAWAAMRAGMTEREVLGLARDAFKGRGASLLFGIVGAGGNGAFPHHQTGDAVLKEGQAVVMDIGARLNGYPSDITRMAIVGQAPDGYDAVHAVVEAAVEAALAAARPGWPRTRSTRPRGA
ncbi:MAG: M24 family metallopeptidase, partial [Pseudomonadota bacterium]